jgi:transcriptional regulator of arginine metabolism
VILRTLPGNASALANLIDKRYAKELFGTLNDDDNVLMITRTEADTENLFRDFQRYV